jgi:hypothetical protein
MYRPARCFVLAALGLLTWIPVGLRAMDWSPELLLPGGFYDADVLAVGDIEGEGLDKAYVAADDLLARVSPDSQGEPDTIAVLSGIDGLHAADIDDEEGQELYVLRRTDWPWSGELWRCTHSPGGYALDLVGSGWPVLTGMAFGDADGDGAVEIYLTSEEGDELWVVSHETAGWEVQSLTLPASAIGQGLTIGDADRDGQPEIYWFGRDVQEQTGLYETWWDGVAWQHQVIVDLDGLLPPPPPPGFLEYRWLRSAVLEGTDQEALYFVTLEGYEIPMSTVGAEHVNRLAKEGSDWLLERDLWTLGTWNYQGDGAAATFSEQTDWTGGANLHVARIGERDQLLGVRYALQWDSGFPPVNEDMRLVRMFWESGPAEEIVQAFGSAEVWRVSTALGAGVLEEGFGSLVYWHEINQGLTELWEARTPAGQAVGEPGREGGRSIPGLVRLALSPNPVRAQVRIHFDLDREMTLRVTALDACGRRVAVLMDGTASSGAHSLEWDLRDARNLPVPGGIYFIALRAGARRNVRMMPVLR